MKLALDNSLGDLLQVEFNTYMLKPFVNGKWEHCMLLL